MILYHDLNDALLWLASRCALCKQLKVCLIPSEHTPFVLDKSVCQTHKRNYLPPPHFDSPACALRHIPPRFKARPNSHIHNHFCLQVSLWVNPSLIISGTRVGRSLTLWQTVIYRATTGSWFNKRFPKQASKEPSSQTLQKQSELWNSLTSHAIEEGSDGSLFCLTNLADEKRGGWGGWNPSLYEI